MGFGAFDGWQKAGFNAKKKLLGCALVPLPAGLGVPKGLERLRWALAPLPAGVWRVWRVLEVMVGKRQASTPRKRV